MEAYVEVLIAVGASVAANCQQCLQFHTQRARKIGVDPLELSKAIETGKSVRSGAARALDSIAETLVLGPLPTERSSPAGGRVRVRILNLLLRPGTWIWSDLNKRRRRGLLDGIDPWDEPQDC